MKRYFVFYYADEEDIGTVFLVSGIGFPSFESVCEGITQQTGKESVITGFNEFQNETDYMMARGLHGELN